MYQPDKTLALIAYIENQFVVSTDSVISSEKEIKSLEKEHKEMKVHETVSLCHKSKYVGTFFHRKHSHFNMSMFVFWVATLCGLLGRWKHTAPYSAVKIQKTNIELLYHFNMFMAEKQVPVPVVKQQSIRN